MAIHCAMLPSGCMLIRRDLILQEVKKEKLNSSAFRLEGIDGLYLIRIITRERIIYQSQDYITKVIEVFEITEHIHFENALRNSTLNVPS